jgi:hypothetical protein
MVSILGRPAMGGLVVKVEEKLYAQLQREPVIFFLLFCRALLWRSVREKKVSPMPESHESIVRWLQNPKIGVVALQLVPVLGHLAYGALRRELPA